MGSAAKYKLCLAELIDFEQALKRGMIDDLRFAPSVFHEPEDWVVELLSSLHGIDVDARLLTIV